MSINFKKFSYDFTESPNFPTEYDDPNYLDKVRSVWIWCKSHNEKLSNFVISLNLFSSQLNTAQNYIEDKATEANSYAEVAVNAKTKAQVASTQSESFWNKIKGYSIPTNATYSANEIDELYYDNFNLICSNAFKLELIRENLN